MAQAIRVRHQHLLHPRLWAEYLCHPSPLNSYVKALILSVACGPGVERIQLGSMRLWIRSLASLSGLRIWRCRGLCPPPAIRGSQSKLFPSLPASLLLVCLFSAAPAAYGGSQARGLIGAVAASLHQSHSNAGSKPCLQPIPQLTARPDG